MKPYSVLLTHDATCSATIYVMAENKKDAYDMAVEMAPEVVFELDEGNHIDEYYVGDCIANNVEEATQSEMEAHEEELKIREYVAQGGSYCPNCGGKSIVLENDERIDGSKRLQDVFCHECHSTWVDVFELVSCRNLEKRRDQ